MVYRSDIDLLGNSTRGENLGSGTGVFKCKNESGNTLQFRTICGSAGISVITGDSGNTLIISGGTGAIPVLSGMSNYVLRVNSTGTNIESSSIYDSGTTNIYICKNTFVLGDGVSPTCVRLVPSNPRKIELIASSGVNIGSYSGNCIWVGKTNDGITVCTESYEDLLLHAGIGTLSGQVGKTLRLSGGDGAYNAVGGNVLLTGGTGISGGSVILSTSNYGKVLITGLPAKTTETCAIYINANGCLSKGTVGTGSTTISGTANYVAKFNATGNNVSNSSILDSGTTEIRILKDCITLGNLTSTSTCIRAHDHATQPVDLVLRPGTNVSTTNTGNLFLDAGKNPVPSIYLGSSVFAGTQVNVQPYGTQSNIQLQLCSKGNAILGLFSTGGLQLGTPSSWACFNGDCLYKVSFSDLCIFGADNNNISATANSTYLRGGDAVNTGGVGGNLILRAGRGVATTGRTYICGLPTRTTETCGIFIDSNKRLSIGVISGGSGGSVIAITGATNGLNNTGNTKIVCLGGLISKPTLLCSTSNANMLKFCTISNDTNTKNITQFNSGGFVTCTEYTPSSWVTCIENSGTQLSINATNIIASCNNQLVIRPDMVQLTSNGGGSNSGWQYAADYCTKMNSNERAIVDSGWVRRYALGGWSNFTNGSTAAGCDTLASGSTKCNTFFGVHTGKLTTGCANTGVGTFTLVGNTTGCFNTAIGVFALNTNSTGCYNTANGVGALNGNTIGHCNVAVGMNALQSNTIGSANVAVGINALYTNTTGIDSVAIGSCALAANNANNNIAIGSCALLLSTVASNNIAIGTCALRTLTTASNNIGIGNQTLQVNTSGSENVAIGYCALGLNTIGIGNTGIGINTLAKNTIGNQNVAIGCYALYNNTGGTYNVGIGYQALLANKGGSNNFAFGANALYQNTNGGNSIAIGGGTLQSNTIGNTNIAIGGTAMQNNTVGTCNIAIGYGALAGAAGHSGTNNIVLGRLTMQANTTGSNNVAIGLGSLQSNTTGGVNTALGEQTLYYNTTGVGNVGVGCGAGFRNSTGNYSVYIGTGAGSCNTGTEVTAVGTNAGFGGVAGSAAARGVFLGRCAGMNETGTDKLHIANCVSCTLICGDFVNKSVYIDNTLCTCTISSPSNLTIKTPDGSRLNLISTNIGTGNAYIGLGEPSTSASITTQGILVQGLATNINFFLQTQGTGMATIISPNVGITPTGPAYLGWCFQSGTGSLVLPQSGRLVGYGGYSGAPHASPICIIGGQGYSFSTNCGCGGDVCITGGAAYDGGGGNPRKGGDVIIRAGIGVSGGATGCTKICGCLTVSGAIMPTSSTDAAMPNNSIYYSTNAGKLVYKDAGGSVNTLY